MSAKGLRSLQTRPVGWFYDKEIIRRVKIVLARVINDSIPLHGMSAEHGAVVPECDLTRLSRLRNVDEALVG